MLPPYTREKIENWVSDFAASDRLRETPAATHEHAAIILTEFMLAACSPRESFAGDAGGFFPGRDHAIEPDEIEDADARHALLNHVARMDLPAPVRSGVIALCAAFVSQLEDEGRLSGGHALGAYVRALGPAWSDAASGRRKPIERPGAKIGRNDPCPCGSGRKYKTCCMRG